MASKSKKKGGGAAAGESVGPDPLLKNEERLVEALDHVVARCLENPPVDDDLPAAVLQALCELHPRFKERAEFHQIEAEEQRLKAKVEQLVATRPRGRQTSNQQA